MNYVGYTKSGVTQSDLIWFTAQQLKIGLGFYKAYKIKKHITCSVSALEEVRSRGVKEQGQ